ncbi:hypothetical protein [Pontibacter qinzhouensis]|nr:hypothetical protein [Pontibacter qinzhouensis]
MATPEVDYRKKTAAGAAPGFYQVPLHLTYSLNGSGKRKSAKEMLGQEQV